MEEEMNQRQRPLAYERPLLPFETMNWAIDEGRSRSRQVELVGQAFLALNLVKLLREYDKDSFSQELKANKTLIERGINLVREVQRGENYLTETGQYLIQRPESANIARHIEPRGELSVSETCGIALNVLEELQHSEEGRAVPDTAQIKLARDLLVEIHRGTLDELEDLKSRSL
jgi:hypothetical protein